MLKEIYDRGLFKAVFVTGGPGSGKDHIVKKIIGAGVTHSGLVELTPEKALEYASSNGKEMPKGLPADEIKRRRVFDGRNGVVINGTADDIVKTKLLKSKLEGLGYETHMVMVHTDNETSKKRNEERAKSGGRVVNEAVRQTKWDAAQANREAHQKLFGDRYVEFDNSFDLKTASKDVRQQKEEELGKLHDKVNKFVTSPAVTLKAHEWITTQLHKTDKMPLVPMHPHPNHPTTELATKKNLEYYGYGRYGKNGRVTHRSVNQQLIELPEDVDTRFEKLFVLNESLDMGIESGMALNGYSKEKIDKRGKASTGVAVTTPAKGSPNKFVVKELTGDETTASISAQKEDELKKKGITLNTFKSKQVI